MQINGIDTSALKKKVYKWCGTYIVKGYPGQKINSIPLNKREKVFRQVKLQIDSEYGLIHALVRQEAYKLTREYLCLDGD